MKEITAVETLYPIDGKTAELKKALRDLVPICRGGAGCLQYDLFEPVGEKGVFLVLMRWKSMDDLKRHEASKPVEEFVRKYDGVLYGEVAQSEWISID